MRDDLIFDLRSFAENIRHGTRVKTGLNCCLESYSFQKKLVFSGVGFFSFLCLYPDSENLKKRPTPKSRSGPRFFVGVSGCVQLGVYLCVCALRQRSRQLLYSDPCEMATDVVGKTLYAKIN